MTTSATYARGPRCQEPGCDDPATYTRERYCCKHRRCLKCDEPCNGSLEPGADREKACKPWGTCASQQEDLDREQLANEAAPELAAHLPPQESARDMWLLTPLGSIGRKAIDVSQYEELRHLARKLAFRAAQRTEPSRNWEHELREVAHALGIEHAPDTGPSEPGPLADMLACIKDLKHRLEIAEQRLEDPALCKHGSHGCIDCENRCEQCGDDGQMAERDGMRLCENCVFEHDQEHGTPAPERSAER